MLKMPGSRDPTTKWRTGGSVPAPVREHSLDRTLHVGELTQDPMGEARDPIRSQEAPEGLVGLVDPDVELA